MRIVGEVPRIAAAAFDERAARPVILEGAIAAWPALARWSPAYLAERLGDVQVPHKLSRTGAHPNFHEPTLARMFARGSAPLGALLHEMARDARGEKLFTGDEKPLLRRRDGTTTIDPDLAPLLDDAPIAALAPPDRLYTVWCWFSGANVRTWLHYDNNDCHNLNAQITGEKTCVLLDPAQRARCALFPAGGPNPATNCSQIDIDAPDLARFPEFADAEGVTARLAPGELLFIPANWLHAFRHVGTFNSNLNVWWKP